MCPPRSRRGHHRHVANRQRRLLVCCGWYTRGGGRETTADRWRSRHGSSHPTRAPGPPTGNEQRGHPSLDATVRERGHPRSRLALRLRLLVPTPISTLVSTLVPACPRVALRSKRMNANSTDTQATSGSILGTRVRRTQDPALLQGHRNYVADLPLENRVYATFVRSSIAHGVIKAIHTDAAKAMPGVVAVWTATELDVKPHHGLAPVDDVFARPPLTPDRVRFVGDAYAVVFATSQAAGEDAAEAVYADIDPLPVYVDAEAAIAEGAEAIFPKHGSNIGMVIPDDTNLDLEAISDVVVRGRYVNQRIAVAPLEVDCCAAAPGEDGRTIVWPSTQMPHGLHAGLAAALGLKRKDIHVITPQVGGGFGGKAGLHHEYTVVTKAARVLNRPVVWFPSPI